MIHSVTSLPLSSRHRVSQIMFHPTQPYLAVQSHDRSVEIFRIRTEEEVRKKQARRKKRSKEKKKAKEAENQDSDGDSEVEIKLVDLFTPYLVVRASGKIRSFDFGADDKGHKGGTQVLDTLTCSIHWLM
jgi:U3 small nucleolar RNA-associated protein 12